MMSPVRYAQRKFRAGGTKGSIFSLIAATLGAGTLTFPYAVMMNGIVLGTILIVVGALMSYYTGMLIVKCSVATKVHRYEDFAQKLYGPKCRSITSVLNLLCLMGFIMSYIVYIKSMFPQLLLLFWEEEQLPLILGPSPQGQLFWGTVFAFAVLFPLSIPRQINSLRYSSIFGVLCSVYLGMAVMFVFLFNRSVVVSPAASFSQASYFTVSPPAPC